MRRVALTEFLTFGSLGPIRLGLTPADVESKCGPPADTSMPQLPRIWSYGALQVTFLNSATTQCEELALIGIYFRMQHKPLFGSTRGIKATGWWPTTTTNYDDFVAYLQSNEIEWSIASELTFETQTTLCMPSGVHVGFDKEHSPIMLDSMQFAGQEKQRTNR
jgi:hypothetical protein